jgi:hypothetical protein
MFSRFILSAWLVLPLPGCVTTTPHNLDVQDVRALRLERVDLVLDPTARVHWPDVQKEYTESLGAAPKASDGAKEASVQAARAFVAARLRDKARTFVEPALKSVLAGTKPVTARIVVHGISIPGTFEVIGAALSPLGAKSEMGISVEFLDARAGTPILSFPKTGLSTAGAEKINMGTTGIFSHDPIERMFASFNGQLTSWLVKT